MADPPQLDFYHAPQTRSTGVLTLIEELGLREGTDFTMHLLDMKAGEQRQPAYLAVNPMGKVPALRHGEALITEQGAVYIYLADLFPQAGLAPAVGDALRGPYLRWLVFYGSSFEPAVVDRALKREPAPPSTSPYGDFDTMLGTLTRQLETGPWILGERFTAADVLWGTALRWTTHFGLVPPLPAIQSYIDRVLARPAVRRAQQKDADFAAAQERARPPSPAP
ncbi:MAG: glutathione S-transferase [Thiomonas sp. 15-66-11]|jgi:glutathione S-transferase|nr:MAG: glutathione S-transferase [Thiomonas sp. 15-66-11]